jgi:hypothetical protein
MLSDRREVEQNIRSPFGWSDLGDGRDATATSVKV